MMWALTPGTTGLPLQGNQCHHWGNNGTWTKYRNCITDNEPSAYLLFQISSLGFSKYLLDKKRLLQDPKNRFYETILKGS